LTNFPKCSKVKEQKQMLEWLSCEDSQHLSRFDSKQEKQWICLSI
jgi:hypothetical protein